MHAWKEPDESHHRRDAVREWAELEGKSPQMSDDLYHRHCWRKKCSTKSRWVLGLVVRIISTAAESWWHISRR